MSKYVMTPWRKDLSLIYYLELGLRLLHKCEIQAPLSNDAKSAMRRFQYWRLVLMSKTPHNYRLRWVHLRLSSTDPPTVAEAVWTRAKFLNETDRTAQFAIGVHVVPLPHEFAAVYVIALVMTKLKFAEVAAAKRADVKKTALATLEEGVEDEQNLDDFEE
eukprot:GHVU01056344.1.p1 GENE.GHVU01056344.1~~GHVU01056344.1.p1  ORF type:complete len:161 (-),score=29.81 GHVU01056344.1:541-1023(-)